MGFNCRTGDSAVVFVILVFTHVTRVVAAAITAIAITIVDEQRILIKEGMRWLGIGICSIQPW